MNSFKIVGLIYNFLFFFNINFYILQYYLRVQIPLVKCHFRLVYSLYITRMVCKFCNCQVLPNRLTFYDKKSSLDALHYAMQYISNNLITYKIQTIRMFRIWIIFGCLTLYNAIYFKQLNYLQNTNNKNVSYLNHLWMPYIIQCNIFQTT